MRDGLTNPKFLLTLMERPMCFPPKVDKYHLRSSLLNDEATLPPSKRCHRAQEAMSACVAEVAIALVEPVATSMTRQNDAYNISADEKYYTKCIDNDKKSVKKNEECVKVETLIQKEASEIIGSKKHVETNFEQKTSYTNISLFVQTMTLV